MKACMPIACCKNVHVSIICILKHYYNALNSQSAHGIPLCRYLRTKNRMFAHFKMLF